MDWAGKSNISEKMTAFVNISRLMTNSETLVAGLSVSEQHPRSLFSLHWQLMYFLFNYISIVFIFVPLSYFHLYLYLNILFYLNYCCIFYMFISGCSFTFPSWLCITSVCKYPQRPLRFKMMMSGQHLCDVSQVLKVFYFMK